MVEFVFPFDSVALTNQVNIIPNTYGYINALNLMPSESVSSTIVAIERVNGYFRVLPAVRRGAPGTPAKSERGKVFYLEIPHFPHLDALGPEDIQNKTMMVDGRPLPMTVAAATTKKLASMRNAHAITREYLRAQALKGLIKDGDGNTIVDLYDFFGITKITVDLALGTTTTDVIAKLEEASDAVHNGVIGDTIARVECLIGTTLFNRIVNFPKIEKYWLNQAAAGQLANMERARLGMDWGRVFEFGNIFFRESKASLPVKTGNEALIDKVKGHVYPSGTQNTFATYDGPAFAMSQVNQPGQEIYITEEILDHDKGVEFESQSNVLPLNRRPEAVVELISSN